MCLLAKGLNHWIVDDPTPGDVICDVHENTAVVN